MCMYAEYLVTSRICKLLGGLLHSQGKIRSGEDFVVFCIILPSDQTQWRVVDNN